MVQDSLYRNSKDETLHGPRCGVDKLAQLALLHFARTSPIMVLLQLTEPLLARINELKLPTELANLVAAQLSPSSDEAARSTASTSTAQEQRTISHEVLVKISSWSKTKKGKSESGCAGWIAGGAAVDVVRCADPCTLASLLRLTDIHAPPLAPRVRVRCRLHPISHTSHTSLTASISLSQSPELIAILDSIQLAQDKASYASMTSLAGPQFQSVLPLNDKYEPPFSNGPTKTDAEEWKEIRQQVGAIVNVGASMMAVGTGVWWVGGGRSYAAVSRVAFGGALRRTIADDLCAGCRGLCWRYQVLWLLP